MVVATADTRVHEADVQGSGNRRLVLSNQAFRRLRLAKTEPMDDRLGARRAPPRLHCIRPSLEYGHRVREGQLTGDLRCGVVVATDYEGLDPGLTETV